MNNPNTQGKYIKLLESLRLYNTYSWMAFIPLVALLHFLLDFSYVAGLWFGVNLMLLAMWAIVYLLNNFSKSDS
jgi:hypothetical protein